MMTHASISPRRLVAALALSMTAIGAQAACLDNIVLVHGNTASPSAWNNTVSTLKSRGYVDAQIYRPNWGSKTSAGSNDHGATNTDVVKSSITSAYANSCTGKICPAADRLRFAEK